MMNTALRGKPDAGNPHVRFDEGEVAPENPRRGSLLYKIMRAIVGIVGFLLANAVFAEDLRFTSTTNKDPIDYALNEEMVFTITLVDHDNADQPVTGKTLKWSRVGDDGITTSGTATSDSPLVIKTAIAQPGFVRIRVNYLDAKGAVVSDNSHIYDGGAGADIWNIPQRAIPTGFEDFWANAVKQLQTTAFTTNRFEICSENASYNIRYFELTTFAGERPATGYVVWPKNAAKRSLGITAIFSGYSAPTHQNPPGGNAENIVISISRYGEDLTRTDASYFSNIWTNDLANYCWRNNDKTVADTDYYKMLMRDLRALQFAKSFPEWDGAVLKTTGGSMGGYQALGCAALDSAVSQCVAHEPWSADLSSVVDYGRMAGWRPTWTSNLDFIDLKNLATLVKSQVTVKAGLGDYTCPPSSEAVLFRNLSCTPRSITFVQDLSHSSTPHGVGSGEVTIAIEGESRTITSPTLQFTLTQAAVTNALDLTGGSLVLSEKVTVDLQFLGYAANTDYQLATAYALTGANEFELGEVVGTDRATIKLFRRRNSLWARKVAANGTFTLHPQGVQTLAEALADLDSIIEVSDLTGGCYAKYNLVIEGEGEIVLDEVLTGWQGTLTVASGTLHLRSCAATADECMLKRLVVKQGGAVIADSGDIAGLWYGSSQGLGKYYNILADANYGYYMSNSVVSTLAPFYESTPYAEAATNTAAMTAVVPWGNADYQHYKTWSGYLWNPSSTTETWTVVNTMNVYARLIINTQVVERMSVADGRAYGGLPRAEKASALQGIIRQVTVLPGANVFKLRYFNRWNTCHLWLGSCMTYLGNQPFDNWPDGYGLMFDRQGRGSSNVDDYECFTDPGDGSLFVRLPCAAVFAAKCEQFVPEVGAALDFGGGSLTVTGAVELPVDGLLDDAQSLGSVTFGEGAVLKITGGLSRLTERRNQRLLIARGCEGVPVLEDKLAQVGWKIEREGESLYLVGCDATVELALSVTTNQSLTAALAALDLTLADLNGGKAAKLNLVKFGAGVLTLDSTANLANWTGDLIIREGVVAVTIDASDASTPTLLGDATVGKVVVADGATLDLYSKAASDGKYTGGVKRPIHITGKGAADYGGAIRFYGESGFASIRAAIPYAVVLDDDATIAFRERTDLVSEGKTFDLQGHQLTITSPEDGGVAGFISSSKVVSPGATGAIIFDHVKYQSRVTQDTWEGDSRNRIICRNGGAFNWNIDAAGGHSWTLVYEATAYEYLLNGTAGRSAVYQTSANWLGPIQLDRMIKLVDTTYTQADWTNLVQSFTFNGAITGEGGIYGDSTINGLNSHGFRRQILDLGASGNDFSGSLALTGYDLYLNAPAALPFNNVNIYLTNTTVFISDAAGEASANKCYHLGDLVFSGESRLDTGAGCTALAIDELEVADGSLQISGSATTRTVTILRGSGTLDLGGESLEIGTLYGALMITNGQLTVKRCLGTPVIAADATMTVAQDAIVLNVEGSNTLAEALAAVTGLSPQPTIDALNGGAYATRSIRKRGTGILIFDIGDTNLNLSAWRGDFIIEEGAVLTIVDAANAQTMTLLGNISVGAVYVADGATLDLYSKASSDGKYMSGVKRPIHITGKGAADYGGAIRFYGESGSASIRAAIPYAVVLDDDATIAFRERTDLVPNDKTFNLQGHQLTITSPENGGVAGFISSSKVVSPGAAGAVIFDRVNYESRLGSDTWAGDANNRIVFRNGGMFNWNSGQSAGHDWTLVYEATAGTNLLNGTAGKISAYVSCANWLGPVELGQTIKLCDYTYQGSNWTNLVQSFTFNGAITGEGGIYGDSTTTALNAKKFRRQTLNLASDGNDFTGPLTLKGYDLRLMSAKAMPRSASAVTLIDSTLVLADETNSVYELGEVTFDGASQLTAEVSGASAIMSILKLKSYGYLAVDVDELEVGEIVVESGYARIDLGGRELMVDEVSGDLFVSNGRLIARTSSGEIVADDNAEVVIEDAADIEEANVFSFTEVAGWVANPGQGWMANSESDYKRMSPYIAIGDIYIRFDWKLIEPKEGEFDWSYIDNTIAAASKYGLPIGLRVMCANSGGSTPSVPDWVWDKGATYWEYEAISYQNTIVTNRSPHFDDPILIECHRQCIEALAKRYDGDSRIAGVDLGSYGNWGEWHCSKLPPHAPLTITQEQLALGYYDDSRFAGRTPFVLDTELMKKYVDMYLDNFKQTPVMFMTEGRNVIDYAIGDGEVPRVGLRKDGIGSTSEKNYKYWQDFYGHQIGDIWKHKPIWFEFWRDSEYILTEQTNVDLNATFNWLLTNHVSMLNVGPCSPMKLLDTAEHREWLDRISNYAGARLVLNQIKTMREDDTMRIRCLGENKGVSRIKLDYVLTLSVRDFADEVIYECDLETDPTAWQPGEFSFDEIVDFPAWIPEWALVSLRIRDRQNQIRDFKFAVNELDAKGGLPLGMARRWQAVIQLPVEGEKTLAQALAEVTDLSPQPTVADLNGGRYAGYDIIKTGSGTLKIDLDDSQQDLANWRGDLYIREGVVEATPDAADARTSGLLGNWNNGYVYVEDGATLYLNSKLATNYGSGIQREIYIAGQGATDMGGALCLYGSGSASIRAVIPRLITLKDDATIYFLDNAQLVTERKTVDLSGHTLTVVGGYGSLLIDSSSVINPGTTGSIIFDGIQYHTRTSSELWQGDAANRLIFRNEAGITYNSIGAIGHGWTLVYEPSANGEYCNGTYKYEVTNYFDAAKWSGPVELGTELTLANNVSSVSNGSDAVQAFTFADKISGVGGITGNGVNVPFARSALNLMSGENDFSGAFVLNDYELHLFSPTAMPAGNENIIFTNVAVTLDFDSFEHDAIEPLQLGSANFAGVSQVTVTGDSLGDTRIGSITASRLTVDGGILSLDTTGFDADEIELLNGGELKFVSSDSRATTNVTGLIYGALAAIDVSGGYVNFGTAPYDYRLVSERVVTAPTDFYSANWSSAFNNRNAAYRTYAGYLWNRTGTNATWTIMSVLNHHYRLQIGDKVVCYSAQEAPSNGAMPVPRIDNFTLQPGPNRFELIVANQYVACINGVCNYGPVATNGLVNWEGDLRNCGFVYDPEGRGELDGANYRRFVIGDDEPLFTYLEQPMTRSVATITGTGTIDLDGGELQVDKLDGQVTFVNGKVIAERVVGFPKFGDGATFSCPMMIELDVEGTNTLAEALAQVSGFSTPPTIASLNGGCHATYDIWKSGKGVLLVDSNEVESGLSNWVGNLRINEGAVEVVLDATKPERTKTMLGNGTTGEITVVDGATLDIKANPSVAGNGNGILRRINIMGTGAPGYYGAIRLYGSGTASICAAIPQYVRLLDDASISFRGNVQLVDEYKTVDLQGHELTFTKNGNTGTPGLVAIMYVVNPGETGSMVFDGVTLQTRATKSTMWQGDAANRLIFRNGGNFNWNGKGSTGSNWSIFYEASAKMRLENGDHGVTSGVPTSATWYGPMELRGTVMMTANSYNESTNPPTTKCTQYTTLLGDISGTGGLTGNRFDYKIANTRKYAGFTLTLGGTNTFLGPLALNGYTLRLLSDAALPAFNDQLCLSNTIVRLDGEVRQYSLERLTFVGTSQIAASAWILPTITAERLSVASGSTLTIGDCRLDLDELALADGGLCQRENIRGLVYGCHEYYNPYSFDNWATTNYNAGYVPVGTTSKPEYNYVLYTNSVTQLPGDFYTTTPNAVFGKIACAYRTYSGYIWNTNATARQWTIMSTLNCRYRLKVGDEVMLRMKKDCPSAAPINATYKTFTLQPGPNRFEFTIGNAYSGVPLTSFSATNNLENWSAVATSSAYSKCGFFIDCEGRGSLDINNYEPINSAAKVAALFTTVADCSLGEVARLTGKGTLDLGGGDLQVEALEGDAVIENGTVYARQISGNPSTGLDGHVVKLEERTMADCSLAIPDATIGQVNFEVIEQKLMHKRSQPLVAIDFTDTKTYRSDSGTIAYANMTEGAISFVRVGRSADGASCYGIGVCPSEWIAVNSGTICQFEFEARVQNSDAQALIYLRMRDANNQNVCDVVACPDGWTSSSSGYAFCVGSIDLGATNVWVKKSYTFDVPDGVAYVWPILTAHRGGTVDYRYLSIVAGNRRQSSPIVFDAREMREDGSVVLTSDEEQLRLEAAVRLDDAGAFFVTAKVADLNDPPQARAFDVVMNWPHDLTGWKHHRTWRKDDLIAADSQLSVNSAVTSTTVGTYPFSSVSTNDVGVLVGTGFGPTFESRVVTANGIASTIPLGLAERQGRPDVGTSATFEWMLMRFVNKRGMRSAMKAYYASQARHLPMPGEKEKEGTWLFPTYPNTLPENPDDFGLAYWEGPEHITSAVAAVEAARQFGIGVFAYTECGGMRQSMTLRNDGSKPSEAEMLSELQSWAAETNTHATWFYAPRNISARACLNSMPELPSGGHPYSDDFYSSWSRWWKTNPDPRLTAATNRAWLCWNYTIGLGTNLIDGIYLDSLTTVDGYNNVRPEHLAVMDEPLIYDRQTAKPCANGMQHLVAFVSQLGETIHSMGKRLKGNVFGIAYRFHALTVDVCGSEVGSFGSSSAEEARNARLRTANSDDNASLVRFYSYRRPIANLLQEGSYTEMLDPVSAVGMTNYVENQMFYGFYPGVSTIGGEDHVGYDNWRRYFDSARQCERDRALFKRAIPLIRRMNRAKWVPETQLTVSTNVVYVEQYGAASLRGDCLIAVRNTSTNAVDAVLTPDVELSATAKVLQPLWRDTTSHTLDDGVWQLHLEPWQTEVYRAYTPKPGVMILVR